MNGHRPPKLAALFRRVDEATAALDTIAPAAAAAADAAGGFAAAAALPAVRCTAGGCHRTAVADGRCHYHDSANEIPVEIIASLTQRWLRSLAYAKGVAADAAALDAEVPQIAAQILADRAPVVAYDRGSGTLGSLIALIAPHCDATVTIRVPLPPQVREVYTAAAAAAEQTIEDLIGRYLDRIAADAIDR